MCVVYSAKLATEIVVVFRIHSMHWVCRSLDGMTTMSLAWTAATTELSCRVLLTWQRTRAPLTRWVPLLHSECTSYTVSVFLHSECPLTQWVHSYTVSIPLTQWAHSYMVSARLTQWVPSYTVSAPLTWWVPLLHHECPSYTECSSYMVRTPITPWVPLLHCECPSYTVRKLLHGERTSYPVNTSLTQGSEGT